MRRRGLSIVIILLCYSGTFAQLIKGYGVKTCAVISNQDFNYTAGLSIDTKNRTGFDFGISIEWFSLPFFSLLTRSALYSEGDNRENAKDKCIW